MCSEQTLLTLENTARNTVRCDAVLLSEVEWSRVGRNAIYSHVHIHVVANAFTPRLVMSCIIIIHLVYAVISTAINNSVSHASPSYRLFDYLSVCLSDCPSSQELNYYNGALSCDQQQEKIRISLCAPFLLLPPSPSLERLGKGRGDK